MPRILKSLRKIHSYLGLLILPWIIAFGFTGFYLNHSELILSALPLNTYEDNYQTYMDLEQPLTLEQSANIARGYWPESKMLSVERISYHEQSAIEFKRQNGSIIVVPKLASITSNLRFPIRCLLLMACSNIEKYIGTISLVSSTEPAG